MVDKINRAAEFAIFVTNLNSKNGWRTNILCLRTTIIVSDVCVSATVTRPGGIPGDAANALIASGENFGTGVNIETTGGIVVDF